MNRPEGLPSVNIYEMKCNTWCISQEVEYSGSMLWTLYVDSGYEVESLVKMWMVDGVKGWPRIGISLQNSHRWKQSDQNDQVPNKFCLQKFCFELYDHDSVVKEPWLDYSNCSFLHS